MTFLCISFSIARPKIIIPLPDDDLADVQRRQHRYGDFSTLNRLWNQSRSDTTHQRLQANPEEWAHYHTLYQESRKAWSVIPYEEMIRWCQQRSGYVIGDFSCGEAKLAEAVSDRHTVYSFDHIAINNNVIACDMAHVPLNDEEMDVAIFSLSLMGSNFTDYLREAYRILKLDGQLHIIEATSRFSNLSQFRSDLEALGFDVVSDRNIWKFTHIRALKTERKPQDQIELRCAIAFFVNTRNRELLLIHSPFSAVKSLNVDKSHPSAVNDAAGQNTPQFLSALIYLSLEGF